MAKCDKCKHQGICKHEENMKKYETEIKENDGDWNSAIDRAISIVQEVAKEYGNGWIPCSERLPDTYDNLLICQSDGYVGVGYYTLKEFRDLNSYPYGGVIAWQPLPAPYQKGE